MCRTSHCRTIVDCDDGVMSKLNRYIFLKKKNDEPLYNNIFVNTLHWGIIFREYSNDYNESLFNFYLGLNVFIKFYSCFYLRFFINFYLLLNLFIKFYTQFREDKGPNWKTFSSVAEWRSDWGSPRSPWYHSIVIFEGFQESH